MESFYGKRGGSGPTRGRKASIYEVTLPTGEVVRVRKFISAKSCIATGFINKNTGKPCVVVWGDRPPAWEGEFGRMKAVRVG